VNTSSNWKDWNKDGELTSNYVRASRRAGVTPVLTYYQLLQSKGPPARGGEQGQDLANLDDKALMKGYYADLELALRRAHEASRGRLVVLHVEPDLWGYVEQRAGRTDDPGSVPAAVASTGLAALAGLPDTAAGFAQAVVRLRDRIAPEVRLGYHMSTWGTGTDPTQQDPDSATVDALAARSAKFYKNLRARFDMVFSDPSDRDDGFDRNVNHDRGRDRWTALPDTWKRFQDTHVEALLGRDPATRRAYRDAGVIAFLFGGGADGTTSERTDGGTFERLAGRYAHAKLRVQVGSRP
jgi:hypothetical protein